MHLIQAMPNHVIACVQAWQIVLQHILAHQRLINKILYKAMIVKLAAFMNDIFNNPSLNPIVNPNISSSASSDSTFIPVLHLIHIIRNDNKMRDNRAKGVARGIPASVSRQLIQKPLLLQQIHQYWLTAIACCYIAKGNQLPFA
ncbi:hypothetical protein D3C77_466940 [compost metagenome]